MVATTTKQLEIYNTAKKLFVEKGYTETSMRDIAAVLHIKAASLYSHISSKEEILDYICNDVFERLRNSVCEMHQSDLSMEQKFAEFIKIYVTESLKDVDSYVLYQRYWKLSETHAAKFAEGKELLQQRLKDILEANLSNDTKLECFIDDATTILILNVLHIVPHLVANKENPDIDRVVAEIQNRLLLGYGR